MAIGGGLKAKRTEKFGSFRSSRLHELPKDINAPAPDPA